MLKRFSLKTQREGLSDITSQVQAAVDEAGMKEGAVLVYCPHTTAAITINENADPAVARDLLYGLSQAFPDSPAYRHMEGNSHAHLKSSAVGASELVIVEGGRLLLGTWQGIYFCEFDGPRTRVYYVKTL